MTDLLATLNPQQREAVQLPLGPALILAGPGSGKTRVLTHRLAYLVRELGLPRWSILAVTFTNKAANEMKERVAALLDTPHPGLSYGTRLAVGTFHAMCARILRTEVEHTPYEPNWTILDRQDQDRIFKEMLKADSSSDFNLYDLRNQIGRLKNQSITPEVYAERVKDPFAQRLQGYYLAYQRRLGESNALDFDDLLMQSHLLLKHNPQVLSKYRQRWCHVLVDEFQDTNGVQYDFLKLLTHCPESQQHLYVVGDEDQSIYAFRGANYENLNRFRRDFKGARTLLLEENYRSTPQILGVANGLIAHNSDRDAKKLFTHRPPGQRALLCQTPSSSSEADWISQSVKALIQDSDYSLNDICLMYRTNAQSRELEEALRRLDIPYRVIGALEFYERAEIKDALAYLRVIANPRDKESLIRIINRPTRGIGAKTVERLLQCSQQWHLDIASTMDVICLDPEHVPDIDRERLEKFPLPFSRRAVAALKRFHTLWQSWREELDKCEDAGAFLRHVSETSSYGDYLRALREDDPVDREENLNELISSATHLPPELEEEELALNPVELFLLHVSLVSAQDELEDDEPRVSLMTLHTSKGLEFPVVYIAGLVEDLLPHALSTDSPQTLEEERRLLYVGITRAMDLLFLTRSSTRSSYYGEQPCERSRFLDEIPGQALMQETYPAWYTPARMGTSTAGRERNRRSRSRYQWTATADTVAETAAPTARQFKPAMKVRHPLFGSGTVISSSEEDGDELVSIVFDDTRHGLRKFLASQANLTITGKL